MRLRRNLILLLCLFIMGLAACSPSELPKEEVKESQVESLAVSLEAAKVHVPEVCQWSGGSGRLSFIRCNQVMTYDDQTYGQLEFSSSNYDQVRVDDQIYEREGGEGTSLFTIPIELDTNMKISGRTTAMSEPHWVDYEVYISLSKDGNQAEEELTQGLLDQAPGLTGLTGLEEQAEQVAEYARAFAYDKGIWLVQIAGAGQTGTNEENQEGLVESDSVISQKLYGNPVINYLLIPEGQEAPAGAQKYCIIVKLPVDKCYVASEAMPYELAAERMTQAGTLDAPDFKRILLEHTKLAILPSEILGQEVYETLGGRFASLGIPMILDRSGEEDQAGQEFWETVIYKNLFQ